MHKPFLRTGAILVAVAVILGAFGAHSIKEKVTAEVLAIFETGVRYQAYHGLALILTGIIYMQFKSKLILLAGWLFRAGCILFSGSLYLLCYQKYIGKTNLSVLGIITPLGGAAFIAGWIFLVIAVSRNKYTD